MLREGLAPVISVQNRLQAVVAGLRAEQRVVQEQSQDRQRLEAELKQANAARDLAQDELHKNRLEVQARQVEIIKYIKMFRGATEDKIRTAEQFGLFMANTYRALDQLCPGHNIGLPPWSEQGVQVLRLRCASSCSDETLIRILRERRTQPDQVFVTGTRPPVLVEHAPSRKPGSILVPASTSSGGRAWRPVPVTAPELSPLAARLTMSPLAMFHNWHASHGTAACTTTGSVRSTVPIPATSSGHPRGSARPGPTGTTAPCGPSPLPLPQFWAYHGAGLPITGPGQTVPATSE